MVDDAFDHDGVAVAVAEAFAAATGVRGVAPLARPRHVGAVAVGPLSRHALEGVDWAALASDLQARTGLAPVCAEAHDAGGRPAALVVFDVPGVDPDWRYEYANRLPFRYRAAA